MRDDYSRLSWRCRRGLLELDLLLQSFLDFAYPKLTDSEKRAFERLLEFPDPELLEYLMGSHTPRERELAHVAARIRNTPPA